MTEPAWEKVRWHEWYGLRCVADDVEIVVGVSAGPRVLSLSWRGGPNLLHRDMTGFGVDDWRMFGGHRCSIAPESAASYVPDNAPCAVRREGRQLVVESTLDDGLRREWTLRAPHNGEGFTIEHALTNSSAEPWRGALWAMTCVEPEGCVVSPCADAAGLVFAGVPSDPGADVQWSRRNGFVITTPQQLRGKAGWHSPAGWLALLRSDATFLIHAPEIVPRERCVHGGCNAEVFISRDYLELETLGAEVVLAPGERATHRQRWLLLPGGIAPECAHEIAAHTTGIHAR